MTCHYSQAEGKQYFGCESLVGVQLEDQGDSGTAGSHWEKRILEASKDFNTTLYS